MSRDFQFFLLKKQDITWLYRIYILNDVHTNPQKSWKQNGKPFPNLSIEQIKDIRNASKLHQSRISKLEQRMVTLELTNTPNVVLVQYCSNEYSGCVFKFSTPDGSGWTRTNFILVIRCRPSVRIHSDIFFTHLKCEM